MEFGTDPVRQELQAAIGGTWDELSRPGAWWDAGDRRALADAARAAFVGNPAPNAGLPAAALEAAAVLAARPATTTEAWVAGVTDQIGELRYLELVGLVARVTAVDTFCRLLGREPEALPEPVDGAPSLDPAPEGIRRNRTWVAMAMPVPPYVLGAVPTAMAAMNDLCEQLYMPPEEMGDPDWQRNALHRTEMELVAATVSHENQCFY